MKVRRENRGELAMGNLSDRSVLTRVDGVLAVRDRHELRPDCSSTSAAATRR
jgi:hypothetical protein